LAIRSAVRLARSDVGAGLAGVKSTSFATSRLKDFTTIFFDQGMELQISEGTSGEIAELIDVMECSRFLEYGDCPTELESGKAVECSLRIKNLH
jgi:hypothetical protein